MDLPPADPTPRWCIGQHESKRSNYITEQLLREAQDLDYDTLTTPITTPQFHSSVQAILSTYFSQLNDTITPDDVPIPLIPPLKPTDTPLLPNESISQYTIAFTSPWIDLASPDPVISNISRQILNLELAYLCFCGVSNVIVKAPAVSSSRGDSVRMAQFARAILEALSIGPYLQLHVLFSMSPGKGKRSEESSHLSRFSRVVEPDVEPDLDPWAPWEAWDLVRSICKYSGRLSVALELPKFLPHLPIQSRWFSEPVRILIIPESSFVQNKGGYPVLSKAHKPFLTKFMRLRHLPWILLSDVAPIPSTTVQAPSPLGHGNGPVGMPAAEVSYPLSPTPAEAAQMSQSQSKSSRDDHTAHLIYLRYLQRNQPPDSEIGRFGHTYKDYLQAPLQPLADNLESITYEVFEKDPVKYKWYEEAIMRALLDWSEQGKTTSSSSGAVVVAVAGAGRGPLVERALRASNSSQVPIELWAVEKNPNAFVLLQRYNLMHWNGQVTVVKSDMRAWKGPTQADGSHSHVDILVSELLGSFGDNELSPECLDGVQHVLNPVHGISIPSSYTAHITPIATPRIHAELRLKSNIDKECFELPAVVMLHQFDFLSYTLATQDDDYDLPNANVKPSPVEVPIVQECWQFSHPLPSAILAQSESRRAGGRTGGSGGLTGGDGWNDHNARFAQLTFPCPTRGVCHGLAGYFETVLYNSADDGMLVELSTNPLTMDAKSKDMISWFPIFFPLRTPVSFPDNSELKLSIWRNTDDRKVWYEWHVESYVILDDRKVRLGASELHSSKKNGCLM